ncbi:MAG: metal-dependent hydrolase [Planctomycetota bacterium]|jgi:L-ascorbate metabolism protein UlaG (beta-lactamase superfamily)
MSTSSKSPSSSGIQVTWHGHSTWSIHTGKFHVLIDPFLESNPAARTKPSQLHPTHILISHGHFDHIADAAEIAKRSGAEVLANYEIATWLSKHHGVQKTIGMNLGGSYSCKAGRFQLVPALHSSSLPDGSYGGTAGGWLLDLELTDSISKRIYYAGDTALFSDMQWMARKPVALMIVPIGDLFTMGIEDSVQATRFVHPQYVMPTHFNTWPPIAQDEKAWASEIDSQTDAEPVLMTVDQAWTLPA